MKLTPIVLDEVESKVFRLLTECVREERLNVVLRVAGGWVRDKILGLTTHDIDIAIDSMTGHPFASKLSTFLSTHKSATKTSGMGTIRINPERSKHLETATMEIEGVQLDFVNLRSESYAELDSDSVEGSVNGSSTGSADKSTQGSLYSAASSTYSVNSRIPTKIAFGSPREDALRRDITINSLFYNLHTEQVEDWSGLGLSDLSNGLVRTPLDPLLTLSDDPLRVLRVLRFAARFNYSIVQELHTALHDPFVHEQFMRKVSRERVGIEVQKMVSCVQVLKGMEYLLSKDILCLIVPLLPQPSPANMYSVYKEYVYEQYADRRLAAICFMHLSMTGNLQDLRPKDSPVFKSAKEHLKLSGSDFELVGKILWGVESFLKFEIDPVKIGRLIGSIGEHWRLSVYLAKAYSILNSVCVSYDSNIIIRTIENLNIADCYKWTALLNGNEIKDAFGLKDGKKVGSLLQTAHDLRLLNPSLSKFALLKELSDDYFKIIHE